MEGVRYDRQGRMVYHPDFHPNQGKPFSDEEIEYLCKFYDYDDRQSLAFGLGRTESSVQEKVFKLKKRGVFEIYKRRWERQFEEA